MSEGKSFGLSSDKNNQKNEQINLTYYFSTFCL